MTAVTTDTPTHLLRCNATELMLGGDWAMAENHTETLAMIARQLATRVRPGERRALEDVARLIDRDPAVAAALWKTATAVIRRRRNEPGPRRDDPPQPPEKREAPR